MEDDVCLDVLVTPGRLVVRSIFSCGILIRFLSLANWASPLHKPSYIIFLIFFPHAKLRFKIVNMQVAYIVLTDSCSDACYDRGVPDTPFFLRFPQFGSLIHIPKTDLDKKL